MATRDAIRRAVVLFAANTSCDLDGVIAALEREGFPPEAALSIIEFLPMAFGRAVTEDMGVRYPDYYIRLDPKTKQQAERKVMEEPVYREARALFPEIAAQGGTVLKAVLIRSSEFLSVNDALHAGSKPENLESAPPILFGADREPAHLDFPVKQASQNERPPDKRPKAWWQFWK